MKKLLSYGESINEATIQSMRFDKKVFIIGLGITDKNGVYKTTGNLLKKFGKKRVVGFA